MHFPVLIVEDDEAIRWVLRQLLEDEDYVVEEAASSPEGLHILSTTSQPHVVLLDLHLPTLNGEQIVDALDESPTLARHRYIVMSGSSQAALAPDFIDHLTKRNMHFLAKPFDIAQVIAVLMAVEAEEPAP